MTETDKKGRSRVQLKHMPMTENQKLLDLRLHGLVEEARQGYGLVPAEVVSVLFHELEKFLEAGADIDEIEDSNEREKFFQVSDRLGTILACDIDTTSVKSCTRGLLRVVRTLHTIFRFGLGNEPFNNALSSVRKYVRE